ncbi:hypothetical protein ISS09_04765 [Candidatus Woesearchaeota archaeon]|nr:hypothetical protein [Candidatus Woesearchaeota archaeon]
MTYSTNNEVYYHTQTQHNSSSSGELYSSKTSPSSKGACKGTCVSFGQCSCY